MSDARRRTRSDCSTPAPAGQTDDRGCPRGSPAVLGGGELRVTEIYVGDSESLEAALRRFNKRVQADGILTDARRHEFYEKPSERRKKKEAARRRKLRKAMARAKTRERA